MRNLDLFLSRFVGVPFSRHDNDCLRFVCRWLKHNGLPDLRDHYDLGYRHKRDFPVYLRRAGFESVAEAFDSLGYERVENPKMGDFVQLKSNEDVVGFGVHDGDRVMTISQKHGLCVSGSEVDIVWSIYER